MVRPDAPPLVRQPGKRLVHQVHVERMARRRLIVLRKHIQGELARRHYLLVFAGRCVHPEAGVVDVGLNRGWKEHLALGVADNRLEALQQLDVVHAGTSGGAGRCSKAA